MHGFSQKNQTSLGLGERIAAQAATARPNEGGSAAVKPPEAAEEPAGGAAAVRLENRTHLNQAKYRVKLRNYGDGLGEIGWSFIPTVIPKKSVRGASEDREQNEDRAVRRAKSRLRQLILTAGADHLLTLTYRENVTDYDRACGDLSRFVRLVKGHMPAWIYIAVPERQKRGAWHWHIAVRGRQDVILLRALWRQVVGEGNIDVVPPKGTGHRRKLALIRYLGKYLAKGFSEDDRQLNGRRYRASLGIEVPLEYLTVPDDLRGDVAGFALDCLKVATGSIGFVWNPEELPAGWACSWE